MEQQLIKDVEQDDLNHIKKLVEQGTDINYALKWAAGNGRLEVVKYLVENGAGYTTQCVNIHSHDDLSLREAACNGHFEIVKYLVEHGADIHVWDNDPLRWAVCKGHFEIVKYLIERGANIYAQSNWLLMLAVCVGHFKIVRYIIEHTDYATQRVKIPNNMETDNPTVAIYLSEVYDKKTKCDMESWNVLMNVFNSNNKNFLVDPNIGFIVSQFVW